MFEAFSDGIYDAVAAILSVFPTSPFLLLTTMGNSDVYQWLKYLNWFIPINTFLAILQLWVSGIAVYYVVQIVLRWFKAIE